MLLDYVGGGNLKQLIHSCGNLNEQVIKTIAFSIINALETFQCYTNNAYGTLYPSQILLNDDGTIKVHLVYYIE